MAVEMREKRVLSSDGVHELAGRVYYPEGDVKGLFHVVHGMTEHMERYDRFMRDMASDGYIVFGYDHLGHGYTARDDSELGYIAHKDGYKRLIDDVFVFGSAVKEEAGDNLPYILFGHSMGSFIVRLAAAQYDMQDKLIVSGTGGPNPAAGAGLALIKLTKLFRGERHIPTLAEKMAFGKYNERFGDDDKYNWLTKDEDIRKKYAADKFCTFHFTSSAMGDLVHLNKDSNSKKYVNALNKQKPVLLISGSEDPVGEYGKGVMAVYGMMTKADIPVKMKLYENCRHEILNETCYDEVLADIRKFLSE